MRRWAALCLAIATAAEAQTLSGRVVDATDSLVVSGAQIRVGGSRSTRSDGQGRFTIGSIEPGRREVSVRMLGYALFSDSLDFVEGQTQTRDVYLTRVPRLLSQMVIKGRSMRVPSGFEDIYRRGASGSGVFLTREQIDSLNPHDVIALMHEVPFIHIQPDPMSGNRIETSRCKGMLPGMNVSGRTVTLFLNGVPITDTLSINEILSHFAPTGIQAVEVYNGPLTVPPIFQPSCGVIAIWTRKG